MERSKRKGIILQIPLTEIITLNSKIRDILLESSSAKTACLYYSRQYILGDRLHNEECGLCLLPGDVCVKHGEHLAEHGAGAHDEHHVLDQTHHLAAELLNEKRGHFMD